MLLFGSIYDNTRQHKKILVCVEVIIVSLVVILMIMQLFLIKVLSFQYIVTPVEFANLVFNLQMLLTVLGPAVSILIYLQMFNWFSRWIIPIVLGYLFSLKAASYIVTIWLA